MSNIQAFFLAALTIVGPIALDVAPETNLQAGARQRASRNAADPNRVLLDSLGAYPGATQIREYVPSEGGLGRGYATEVSLEDAPTAVTEFYEHKLLARGWVVLDRHAAISSYGKGNQVFLILRAGPTDPGPRAGARLLKSRTPPAGARFFFEIETGPRHSGADR